MTTEEAMSAILDEKRLSSQERNVLLVLIRRCDSSYWAHVTQRHIVDTTGLSKSTVQRALKSLEDGGYLKSAVHAGAVAYQPYPYTVRRGIDDEQGKHRFIISLDQALILRSDVSAKEADYTLLAQQSDVRRDRARQREHLAQVDIRTDILERLDVFIKAHKQRC